MRDGSGSLLGFAKLTRDLTDRKRSETLEADGAERDAILQAERSARMSAQRAARMKDEFLATLSHELRTPLNSILGWTQILRMSPNPKPEDVQRGIEVIERNTRIQVQLVDELLDLSRIMSGRVRLDVTRLALVDVIQGAIDTIEPAAQAKGLRLENILDTHGCIISGDAGRLQQVFWNLLSNAVKFTPKGGKIQVLLQKVNSHVEISVSDTGIGIPEAFLPQVFDRFSQKDSSSSRRYGGLGLGLAISKQLVELHGGTLSAHSPGEGQGATFIARLPIAILDRASDDSVRTYPTDGAIDRLHFDGVGLPSLENLHILVVDDEADARDLLQRVLSDHGATVTVAGSGDEALKVLGLIAPDVLVSDIGMPGMDGYQLLRQIRSREPPGRRMPALALTAFARGEDRKRAIMAGYQGHVAKPCDMTELLIVIAGLAERT